MHMYAFSLQLQLIPAQVIASAVRKAGIAGLFGLEGAVNVQGEDQKKLDHQGLPHGV